MDGMDMKQLLDSMENSIRLQGKGGEKSQAGRA